MKKNTKQTHYVITVNLTQNFITMKDVDADNQEEAIKKAKKLALKDWKKDNPRMEYFYATGEVMVNDEAIIEDEYANR